MNAEDEVPAPAAYCAPGRTRLAEMTLLMLRERYSSITETPLLEGSTDVILAASLVPLEPALMSLLVDDHVNRALRELGYEDRLARMNIIAQRYPIVPGVI